MDELDRAGGGESEAHRGPGSVEPGQKELAPRYTKPQLHALAKEAYNGCEEAKKALYCLSPKDKHYLATQEEFAHFTIALMFDAVTGNERVTKGQRAAAAWFYRVINDHKEKKAKGKKGQIPQDAEVIDAGADE